MKILFCGDFVYSGNADFAVSNELRSYFASQDYRVVNFEAPIPANSNGGGYEKSLIKAGPHVKNSQRAIPLLAELGINAAALANNHIMDFGSGALCNTKNILEGNGLKTFGAGSGFEEAYKPLLLDQGGEKIAVFNLCQAEFGVVKHSGVRAGYAWINHRSVNTGIKKYAEEGFFIIVFAHAGVEDEEYVLPEWRNRYHELIALGAKYVIASHPHIFQGVENYKGGIIAYSLGNFLFDKNNLSGRWTTGLIVSVDTKNSAGFEAHIVSFAGNEIAFAETEHNRELLALRCSYVQDDQIVERLADELAESMWNRYYKGYYEGLAPHSIKQLVKAKVKKMLGRQDATLNETMLLHNIQIESHRWCVERYLYNKNCKDNNLL